MDYKHAGLIKWTLCRIEPDNSFTLQNIYNPSLFFSTYIDIAKTATYETFKVDQDAKIIWARRVR